jgi:hypothetical protein
MNQRTIERSNVRAWQCRGRCKECGGKIAGCRRVRACLCGGSVIYR